MDSLYLTPIVGAIIGYFTNWLAIKMVFRPYEEKRIFGIKVPFTPGLIAVERERFTEQIGFVITNHLLTNNDLKDKILEFNFEESVRTIISSIEEEIYNSDETFEALLRGYLADDYEETIDALKTIISKKFNEFNRNNKSIDELKIIEEDLVQVLPDILNIIKTILLYDMYGIDKVAKDFFDGLIGSLFQGFGPLVSNLVNSEIIYEALKTKIITSIEEDYDLIENKVIDMLYSSNTNDEHNFEADNIINTILKNILNQKVNSISKIFEIIKKDSVVTKIASKFESYVSEEINNVLSKIDIKNLIIEKINEMPLSEIEKLVVMVAKKEIKAITYVGGVLGFIIGLIGLFFM